MLRTAVEEEAESQPELQLQHTDMDLLLKKKNNNRIEMNYDQITRLILFLTSDPFKSKKFVYNRSGLVSRPKSFHHSSRLIRWSISRLLTCSESARG